MVLQCLLSNKLLYYNIVFIMKVDSTSLKEYIESGDYFIDAKMWYKYKYIYPFSQRSMVFICAFVMLIILSGIIINVYNLFPVTTQIKYVIGIDSAAQKRASIINANHMQNDPLKSVVDIMIRSYVIKRESYNYDDIKNQLGFIKNTSSRIIFNDFYHIMSIDNPSSPIMVYQKSTKRDVSIIFTKYLDNRTVIVKFRTKAITNMGDIVEDMVWEAKIEYEVDPLYLNRLNGSKFDFIVIAYEAASIKNNIKQ